MTRSLRPRLVRAMTACPSRVTSRWRSGRRAVSMASAIRSSSPLTDSMSHSAAVRATTSVPRSRRGADHLMKDMRGRVSGGGQRRAWGYGLATVTTGGQVLDTWYPFPALGPADTEDPYGPPVELAAAAKEDPRRGVRAQVVHVDIDLDAAPAGPSDAYLRLHLLSHRLVRPNTINLDGIFGVLNNVVWTNAGPCPVEDFERTRLRLRDSGPVQVFSVDKFPRMTDYVVPSGVRVADADRVRLGAVSYTHLT